MSHSSQITTVTIFNQSYNIRGAQDPDYVQELARFVDQKMSEVASNTTTVDSLKVAVLAALNIADAYLAVKREGEASALQREAQVARMEQLLAPWCNSDDS